LGGTFNQTKDYYEDDVLDMYGATLETYPGDPTTRSFEYFNLKDEIDWELSGYSFNMGLLYTLKDMVRFGMNIKFPDVISIKENILLMQTLVLETEHTILTDPYQAK
jgi:hypothetical protein